METKKLGGFNFYSVSAKTLLTVNIIPMIGVIFFHWSLFSIMILYWMENIVIGFFNVLKMSKTENLLSVNIKVQSQNRTEMKVVDISSNSILRYGRPAAIVFFIFHYGLFTFVHGIFVFVIFSGLTPFTSSFLMSPGYQTNHIPISPNIGFQEVSFLGILFSFAMIIISHYVSYRENFIQNQEYKKVSTQEQLFEPYGRVVALHIIIMFAGFVLMIFGYTGYAITILIMIKTIIDLFAHNKEHIKIMNRNNNLNIIS